MLHTLKSFAARAAIVATLGILALTAPPPASAASAPILSGCVWCQDSCPSDLKSFCVSTCNSTGGSCATSGCQGQSGTWYDYTITCSNPT